jgi:YfiH family protein
MAVTNAKKKKAPQRRAGRQQYPRGSPWALRRAGELQILRAPALAAIDWVVHGFSTRVGGTSKLETQRDGRKGSEKVLNLGFAEWDARADVQGNREMFFAAVGAGAGKMRLVALRQIHSDVVHRVGGAKHAGRPSALPDSPPHGDAVFTRERGVLLAVQTADCVPILLADTKHRAVAAIHAGWRGTLQRIAEKTLGRMQMELGTRPEDVIAALGPGIGQCCYEVGTEVAKEFQARFPNAREWFEGPFDTVASGENDPNWLPWLTMRPPGHPLPAPRVQLDLIAANRALLTGAGVPAENIVSSGFCTACRTDLFFSYRRERPTGRLMAVIGIR